MNSAGTINLPELRLYSHRLVYTIYKPSSLSSVTRYIRLNLMNLFLSIYFLKEFYKGKNDLGKFKNDVESFVCALMPGSSSQQIEPTPGNITGFR